MLEQISQIANIILVLAILFTLYYVNKNYKKFIQIYLDMKQAEYNKNKEIKSAKLETNKILADVRNYGNSEIGKISVAMPKKKFNNQPSNKVKNRHE